MDVVCAFYIQLTSSEVARETENSHECSQIQIQHLVDAKVTIKRRLNFSQEGLLGEGGREVLVITNKN